METNIKFIHDRVACSLYLVIVPFVNELCSYFLTNTIIFLLTCMHKNRETWREEPTWKT